MEEEDKESTNMCRIDKTINGIEDRVRRAIKEEKDGGHTKQTGIIKMASLLEFVKMRLSNQAIKAQIHPVGAPSSSSFH
jgi:hypothetical protein